jgi:hypothetical protein
MRRDGRHVEPARHGDAPDRDASDAGSHTDGVARLVALDGRGVGVSGAELMSDAGRSADKGVSDAR